MLFSRPRPPAVPNELLEPYGPPEAVFGPNMRFRRKSIGMGIVLVLLGVGFFGWCLALRLGPAPRDPSEVIFRWLAAGLFAIGGAAVYYPLSMRYDWVYVCPGGLIRTRGVHWDAVAWGDIRRFDDCTMAGNVVTIRQCRIITVAGEEWGFLADSVADFERLNALLVEKTGK